MADDINNCLATAVGELGGLAKSMNETLTTLVKSVNEPQYRTFDAQGRPTGFVEETDEVVNLRFGEDRDAAIQKSYRDQNRLHRSLRKSAGYRPWGEFKSFRDVVRDGLANHGSESFRGRFEKHWKPIDDFAKSQLGLTKAIQGMSEGIGADGGFTVMPEFNTQIIDRIYQNDLWSRTDNYTVTGNNMTFLANAETSRAAGSRHGGLRGYWIAEGATITDTKPTFREISLKLVKLGVVVYLTEELLSDSGVALEQYVARKAAEEFNFLIGDSLVNGTGAGQPLGILTAPSLLSVAKETGQAATTLVSENILKMYARFFAPNLAGAIWLHNQDIGPQLNMMSLAVGTGGQLTYTPPGGLSASPYATLLGRPMIPTEFSATLGTQGDILLADLGQILSISKGGVAQAVSTHIEFLTDQTALRFTMRLNARPWESAAITQFKGTNTQSSFVAVDTRA